MLRVDAERRRPALGRKETKVEVQVIPVDTCCAIRGPSSASRSRDNRRNTRRKVSLKLATRNLFLRLEHDDELIREI